MKLVLPDVIYKDSFISFLDELDSDPDKKRINFEDSPDHIRKNFEEYVKMK